jgi:hypothetical protein
MMLRKIRSYKLRKDLVDMWRLRLYSDIHITVTGEFKQGSNDPKVAIQCAKIL